MCKAVYRGIQWCTAVYRGVKFSFETDRQTETQVHVLSCAFAAKN